MQIELDDWEKSELGMMVSGKALNYLGHYHNTGLRRNEVVTMNRLLRLSDKLSGKEPEEDLPYIGYRANNFNAEKD